MPDFSGSFSNFNRLIRKNHVMRLNCPVTPRLEKPLSVMLGRFGRPGRFRVTANRQNRFDCFKPTLFQGNCGVGATKTTEPRKETAS